MDYKKGENRVCCQLDYAPVDEGRLSGSLVTNHDHTDLAEHHFFTLSFSLSLSLSLVNQAKFWNFSVIVSETWHHSISGWSTNGWSQWTTKVVTGKSRPADNQMPVSGEILRTHSKWWDDLRERRDDNDKEWKGLQIFTTKTDYDIKWWIKYYRYNWINM